MEGGAVMLEAETKPLKFTKEQQRQIQQDLINGILTYNEIQQKWGIKSHSLISLVNSGRMWRNEGLKYPLSIKSGRKFQNLRSWVESVQIDLRKSNLTLPQIARKYNKSIKTIEKINKGHSYCNKDYKYPLTSNRKK